LNGGGVGACVAASFGVAAYHSKLAANDLDFFRSDPFWNSIECWWWMGARGGSVDAAARHSKSAATHTD